MNESEKHELMLEIEELAQFEGLRNFAKAGDETSITPETQKLIESKADDNSVLKHDGSVALTNDWDIGNARMIQADEVRARDGDGLKLFEDGGAGVFIKDGGNVGIGTTVPSSKLEVNGNIGFGNGARAFGLNGTVLAFDRGGNYFGGYNLLVGETEGLVVDSGGNVGIGTNEPSAKLEVNGTAKIVGNIGFYNTAPVAKPTVTGSKGGNAALASLITALANLGLIVDNTT